MVAKVVVTRTNKKVADAHWHMAKLASEAIDAQTESMGYSAVLLAGGKSTRMGRDKASIEIDGKALWRRQLDLLAAIDPVELYISGPANGPYAGSDGVIIPDRMNDCGPLAGLSSTLGVCSAEWLAVLAVDMPYMTADFMKSLIDSAERTGRGQIPVHADGQLEPLAAIYPRAAFELSKELLKAGERCLSAFIDALETAGLIQRTAISSEVKQLFANWNRPEDLSA